MEKETEAQRSYLSQGNTAKEKILEKCKDSNTINKPHASYVKNIGKDSNAAKMNQNRIQHRGKGKRGGKRKQW